jgi:hypothetical protein
MAAAAAVDMFRPGSIIPPGIAGYS